MGSTNRPPGKLTAASCIAKYGETPRPTETQGNRLANGFIIFNEGRITFEGIELQQAPENRISFYQSATSGRDANLAAMRFFFAQGPEVPESDGDAATIVEEQQITATVVEAFTTVDDGKVTAFKVTVNRVDVTDSYAAAAVYCRPVGTKLWTFKGCAEDELVFTALADGTVLEIEVRPVLVNNIEATTGFFNTLASSDATQLPPAPNSLLVLDRDGGDHTVGQVPLDLASGGVPSTVLIYRDEFNNLTPGLGATPVAEVGLQFDSDTIPRFIFGRVVPDVAGQPAQRFYWIRAKNGAGIGPIYPSGNGIPAEALL